jgi:hypothetical protein
MATDMRPTWTSRGPGAPGRRDPPTRSGRRRGRRHSAARSRVLAGALSVATFLGLGANMAVRTATDKVAATSGSSANSSAGSDGAMNSSADSSSTLSTRSAAAGTPTWDQAPVTTTHGS